MNRNRTLRRCAVSIALSIAAVVARSPVARASPLMELAGPMGGNAGAQGVVSGPGVASTYFNPALLADAEDGFLLAFATYSEQIGVTLEGRRGGDVPTAVGARNILGPDGQPLPNDVVPTQWLNKGCPAGTTPGTCPPPGFAARPRQAQGSSGQTREFIAFGIVKRVIPKRLTLGFYGMVPVGNLTSAQAFYADEREALFSNSLHPELYGDRWSALSFVLGASLELTPELSLGAAVSLGLTNAANSVTYVQNSSDYTTLLMNNAISTKTEVAPTMGIRYKPVESLRIGAVAHAPEQFVIDTTLTATLPDGVTSGTTRHDVYDWMPWSISAGFEADVLRKGDYTMAVDVTLGYAFWSAYRDRHGDSPAMYGNDLKWKDTFSGVFGLRHTYGTFRAYIDGRYIPSPVPEQVGRSNYVDNDRVGLLLGGDLEVKIGSFRCRPGLQLQGDRLFPKHNTKQDSRVVDEVPDGSTFASTNQVVPGSQGLQTNNTGWPGFSSEGWVWGGAVTLAIPLE